jgi:ATP-dependent DNA helicase RecG
VNEGSFLEMSKREYKTLSKRVKSLLAHEEGYDVDFKRSVGDLKNEDVVAFANSEAGGAILIGVEETITTDGRQQGRIVGCSVGDRDKQSILSRTESCIPPIEVEIFVENSNRKPFFRVEILSGGQKPYCTSGGTYKIRGDGRNKALLPSRLLTMFMESESQEFIERFQNATAELERRLDSLLGTAIALEGLMGEVSGDLVSTQDLADEAMTFSEMASAALEGIGSSVEGLNEKVDALLSHFKVENPDEVRERQWMEQLEQFFARRREENAG